MQALIRSKSAGVTGGRGTAGAGPGRDNARKFKGLLPWRLYNPKQDLHADHIDAHYLCSQVRLICEMALEGLEATIFSVDAKALVRCGPDIPAVSRKNKVQQTSALPASQLAHAHCR